MGGDDYAARTYLTANYSASIGSVARALTATPIPRGLHFGPGPCYVTGSQGIAGFILHFPNGSQSGQLHVQLEGGRWKIDGIDATT